MSPIAIPNIEELKIQEKVTKVDVEGDDAEEDDDDVVEDGEAGAPTGKLIGQDLFGFSRFIQMRRKRKRRRSVSSANFPFS